MIGMIFKFDEAKINAEGNSTVEQLHNMVDQLASKSFLTKEASGHYSSIMGKHAFALVGRTILKLEEEPWFVDNVSEWLMYEDEEAEDILLQYKEIEASLMRSKNMREQKAYYLDEIEIDGFQPTLEYKKLLKKQREGNLTPEEAKMLENRGYKMKREEA